jgi:hypothetical protein
VSSVTARYNAEIIAITCPKCSATPPNRCLTVQGYAHGARLAAAGYQWCGRHKTLERADAGCDVRGQAGKGRAPGSKNKSAKDLKHVVVPLALSAVLVTGATSGCPQSGPGAGGSVHTAVQQCRYDVVSGPHETGNGVSATVRFHCDHPLPRSHRASVWLAWENGGGWFPTGDIVRSSRVPDSNGFTLTAHAACRRTTSGGARDWRVEVKIRGNGPASRAAPAGVPYRVDDQLRRTSIKCRPYV